jgi:hypothetical protein
MVLQAIWRTSTWSLTMPHIRLLQVVHQGISEISLKSSYLTQGMQA